MKPCVNELAPAGILGFMVWWGAVRLGWAQGAVPCMLHVSFYKISYSHGWAGRPRLMLWNLSRRLSVTRCQ